MAECCHHHLVLLTECQLCIAAFQGHERLLSQNELILNESEGLNEVTCSSTCYLAVEQEVCGLSQSQMNIHEDTQHEEVAQYP